MKPNGILPLPCQHCCCRPVDRAGRAAGVSHLPGNRQKWAPRAGASCRRLGPLTLAFLGSLRRQTWTPSSSAAGSRLGYRMGNFSLPGDRFALGQDKGVRQGGATPLQASQLTDLAGWESRRSRRPGLFDRHQAGAGWDRQVNSVGDALHPSAERHSRSPALNLDRLGLLRWRGRSRCATWPGASSSDRRGGTGGDNYRSTGRLVARVRTRQADHSFRAEKSKCPRRTARSASPGWVASMMKAQR